MGFYVYALRDTRPDRGGRIFYVGKGVGDRVYQHACAALEEARDSLKLDTIRDIHAAWLEVGVEIVRHGMPESVAFEVEAGLIDGLRLAGIDLTNEVVGMDSVARGWHPLNELIALYGAQPLQPTNDRLLLIKINRLYKPTMSEAEIYEVTRKWWRCNPHRRRPDVALAVYRGIVRAAYHQGFRPLGPYSSRIELEVILSFWKSYRGIDPLRRTMNNCERHTGGIKACLASTQLPQIHKPLLLTLP